MHIAKHAINLTATEKRIFGLLLDVRQANNFNTVLRVAGGWVRDKVLGRDSDDIDITLDNMMGRAFAEKVNEYLKEKGEETHTLAVIQANPDQSKHLETATLKVYNHWIDFANLRSEDYSSNSRIPTIAFGTPEQDALRRDFTINALFYNINECVIEDYTQKGIADLNARILRTPLPPLSTFIDDPLRVLRAVRFCARFQLTAVNELWEAAKSSEVHKGLEEKVSRERFGQELEGMLSGTHPIEALRLICEINIYPVLFKPPIGIISSPKKAMQVLETLRVILTQRDSPLLNYQKNVNNNDSGGGSDSVLSVDGDFIVDKKYLKSLYLAAFLFPHSGQKADNHNSVAFYIVRNSLRINTEYAKFVDHMHDNADQIISLVNRIHSKESVTRAEIGNVIHRLGSEWRLGFLFASTVEHYLTQPENQITNFTQEFSPPIVDSIMTKYCQVIDYIYLNKIHEVLSLKHLITGPELKKLLTIPPGPIFGEILKKEFDWQMNNPEKGLEDCKEFLLNEFKDKLTTESQDSHQNKKKKR